MGYKIKKYCCCLLFVVCLPLFTTCENPFMVRILKPFDDLQAEVDKYGTATKDMTIRVLRDMTLASSIEIPGNSSGRTLTIKSGHRTLKPGPQSTINGGLFTIADADARVVFENIIIDGNRGDTARGFSLVSVSGGEVILGTGAVLRNNYYNGSGGGVNVTGGLFRLDGGTISGNTATVSGGGVNVTGGTFFISNGTIYGSNEPIASLRNTTDDPEGYAALNIEDGHVYYGSGTEILAPGVDGTIRVVNGVPGGVPAN